MSLSITFEPHSWYRGFAIRRVDLIADPQDPQYYWEAVTDNGISGFVDTIDGYTLKALKQLITNYRSK